MNKFDSIFNKSLDIVKKSLEDIQQEMVIILNGEYHIVYINKISVGENGECYIDFNTPSESIKNELYVHVEKCVKLQIESIIKQREQLNYIP